MRTVGVRDLKQNASAVVAEVAAGATVTVTHRGRPVARIVPVSSDPVVDLVAAGRARPAKHAVSDLGPALAARGRLPLSDLLSAMRRDER